MIDPKKVTPLLSNMSIAREIGRGPNGTVYQVTRQLDGKAMTLKHISIPAKDSQTQALIYAGAVSNETEAQRYYSSLVKEIKDQLLLLNGIQTAPNLLKFRGYQVDQKVVGAGYDVYLLADFRRSLPEFLASRPISKLEAANLAIDLCSALEQLRSADLIHSDVRPNNIFMGDNQKFLLGDLGLVKKSELPYSSMPDETITEYTAPEVIPADAPLSDTMDIYAVGMILYEIYNGFQLPESHSDTFTRLPGELPAPAYADEAMSDMILRACAYDPKDRYQDPSEMKEALVLYLQRAKLTDEPLLPQPEPEEAPEAEPEVPEAETEAADETEAAGEAPAEAEAPVPEAQVPAPASRETEPSGGTAVEDELSIIEAALANPDPAASMETTVLTPMTEGSSEDAADAEPAEETAAEVPDADATKVIPVVQDEAAAQEVPEIEQTKRISLNDIGEDDLLVPSSGDISVEDFLASIRTTPGLEVLSMDASGNTVTMPGYETEETLPEDTQYLDSADSRVIYPEEAGSQTQPEYNSAGSESGASDHYDPLNTGLSLDEEYARLVGEAEAKKAQVTPRQTTQVQRPKTTAPKAEKPAKKSKQELKAEQEAQKKAEKAKQKADKKKKKSKKYDDFDQDYDDGTRTNTRRAPPARGKRP